MDGPVAGAARAQAPNPDIGFRYGYVSFDRFRVRLVDKKRDEPISSLVFERRGLFSWKLIRLELPDDILKTPAPAREASPPEDIPTTRQT